MVLWTILLHCQQWRRTKLKKALKNHTKGTLKALRNHSPKDLFFSRRYLLIFIDSILEHIGFPQIFITLANASKLVEAIRNAGVSRFPWQMDFSTKAAIFLCRRPLASKLTQLTIEPINTLWCSAVAKVEMLNQVRWGIKVDSRFINCRLIAKC